MKCFAPIGQKSNDRFADMRENKPRFLVYLRSFFLLGSVLVCDRPRALTSSIYVVVRSLSSWS